MSAREHALHTQQHQRQFGVLFKDVSIDQAARKVARAAVSWGGVAVVFVDEQGRCSAAMAGTPATQKIIERNMWIVVGTYHVTCDDTKSKQYRDTRDQIAVDIQHHWQLLSEAAA
jgi:xanthine dehydrogenase iron-sulfur cluster and FAD-binding subunit A